MYYDRRVSPELLDLLRPERPLGWLVPWLRSEVATSAGAHVQLRRDRSSREGEIQVYLGRTSPLVIGRTARGRIKFSADSFYMAMSPVIFAETVTTTDLVMLADALREHIELAAEKTHRSFLDGEAVAHAGLMRLYGPLAQPDAPFAAIDSEARIGFSSKVERAVDDADLKKRIRLPVHEQLPQKLDLVGLRRDGALLLVEVKADAAGMTRAAWQAAAHVARFASLLDGAGAREAIVGLAEQKVTVGLLGDAVVPSVSERMELVPVVAAPDERPAWRSAWLRDIEPVAVASGTLGGLRLWRLAPAGRVLDDLAAWSR